jgi:hypothetical protein
MDQRPDCDSCLLSGREESLTLEDYVEKGFWPQNLRAELLLGLVWSGLDGVNDEMSWFGSDTAKTGKNG